MKSKNNIISLLLYSVLILALNTFSQNVYAQEEGENMSKPVSRKVKNTFESVWIIDNQTVMVPIKGTLEFDISHRFGSVNHRNAISDLWGLFAPSNIRLGTSFAPINNLNIGLGLTKDRMIVDGSAKYAILKQTQDSWAMPVSVTYYGNASYDALSDPGNVIYKHETDRFKFFHQIIIARKISDKFSIQVAPSLSHQNFVQGYIKQIDEVLKEVRPEMKHEHFAISVAARYKITDAMGFIVNYDQPITQHFTNNPNPNLSFGFDFGTSGHSFQIFAGNYTFLSPQRNNLFNRHSPLSYTDAQGNKIKGGNFFIGFNITRLWNL
jgi:hypothetical protein